MDKNTELQVSMNVDEKAGIVTFTVSPPEGAALVSNYLSSAMDRVVEMAALSKLEKENLH